MTALDRRRLLGTLALASLIGLASAWHARRPLAPTPRAHAVARATPAAAAAAAPDAVPADDKLPSRDAFAGSRRCGDCHARNHARWQQDWHARALAEARPGAVLGAWSGVHFKGDSSEAWMRRDGPRHVVRTRDGEGRLGDHVVDWVLGGKHMQDPLTVLPDGRWQVLPIYYHVTGQGNWVDYNEAKQGRVTAEHPFFWTNFRRTANRECLDCHVTGLDVRYDRATHTWSTRFADAGVACESCHGPGARHAQTRDPLDIVQPRQLDPERSLAVCAQCHGPRNPLFPILDARHRFRPGERYEDHYDVYVITTGGPERSLDFFADGRPKSSSFEYQALLQSRCHRQGGATCLSCHTAPHGEHADNELKTTHGHATSAGDESCRACHARLFDDVAAHSRHRSREAQSCVACHMPRVLPGVLDLFADHALDVPVPLNTLRHGIPNACNTCHAKESAEAMDAALRRLWPDAERRQARRLRLADALDPQPSARTQPALAAVAADTGEAPSLRGAAAMLLALQRPRAAAGTLVPLLRDASAVVRAKAVTALTLAGAAGAAPEIVPLLRDDALPVRQAAALALAGFNRPEGEPALRALVADPATAALPQPHLALATIDARRGAWDTAAARLDTVLSLQPYSAGALLLLADLRARQGRWPDVDAALQEALRFDPQNPAARVRVDALAARSRQLLMR